MELIEKSNYYDSGKIKEEWTENIEGNIDGVYKKYDEEGKKVKELHYMNGKRKEGREYEYYQNGKILSEKNFDNGELKGICKEFYENGRLKKIYFYLRGQKNGEYKEFYENGDIKEKGKYILGNKDGVWEYHSKNGDIKEEIYYEGKKINYLKATAIRIFEWFIG